MTITQWILVDYGMLSTQSLESLGKPNIFLSQNKKETLQDFHFVDLICVSNLGESLQCKSYAHCVYT